MPPVFVDLPSAPIAPAQEQAFSAGVGLPTVASGFDAERNLIRGIPVANSSAPDVVGAFRFVCGGEGQLSNDDPILYPSQPGRSHLHQYYGNLEANAHSTYQSLRASGKSTCNWSETPGNRSGYWMPAMLDGHGHAVRPDAVSIYYKRRPISDPACADRKGMHEGKCVPLPNGLRFIFGWDPVNPASTPTGAAYFDCTGPTAKPGHYANLREAAAACPFDPSMPADQQNQLGAVINAPMCWDGKNLDSADHRSHVGYPVLDHNFGKWKCDAAHPYVIPAFTMGAWYTVDANVGLWRLSSDSMAPGAVPGSTFHADWFGAWDEKIMATWMDHCINKLLTCAGGNLGNGTMMDGAAVPTYGWRQPIAKRLVPLSSIPTTLPNGMPRAGHGDRD